MGVGTKVADRRQLGDIVLARMPGDHQAVLGILRLSVKYAKYILGAPSLAGLNTSSAHPPLLPRPVVVVTSP